MNLLANLAVNLKATGPAAVLISWIFAIAAVGLFGSGDLAREALRTLEIFGSAVMLALIMKA